MPAPFRWSRRSALAGLVATPILAPRAFASPAEARAAPVPSCVLTAQSVEGPYYFDPHLVRADITEGHQGVPMRVRLVVMSVADCQPLAGARVDIWHARADGLYSGYAHQGDDHAIDTSGGTFMRGTQTTDANGEVTFRTVYPGWYEGRTPHVHFKVLLASKHLLTGQMFFPDALSEYVYGHVSAYKRTRLRDTFNASDDIALMDKARGGYCDVREQADGYLATLIVGVDRNTEAVVADMGPPPDGGDGRPPPPPGGFRGPPPPGFGPPRRAARNDVAIVPGVSLSGQTRG